MFADAGYSVIPSFLEAGELPRLLDGIEAVLASPQHCGMSRPGNDLVPLRWNDDLVARILQLERRLRLLRDVVRPRDLKWLSAYVSTKRPQTPALWWHQDWWCWDHPISFRRPAPQIAVLCYLSATDAENGALRVLPGSHHASTTIHAVLPEPHAEQANGLAAGHPAMADQPGQVTLALNAGDAVVLDYRLLHGTHANSTRAHRHCILLSFIPAWSELPTEIKAHMIAHPALPARSEAESRFAAGYDDLLPSFAGAAASLPVNRIPPASFLARD
jgi:hypothetical protein